jgi:large subunit ribosomal protein L21
MYAVIRVAGFQYRVEKGQTVRVPLLDAAPGSSLTLEDVLLVQDGSEVKVGQPTVAGASVAAAVVAHGRTPKTEAGKFKRRRKYRRRWGYRQDFTELRIDDIRA